jgi:hypothetical protein
LPRSRFNFGSQRRSESRFCEIESLHLGRTRLIEARETHAEVIYKRGRDHKDVVKHACLAAAPAVGNVRLIVVRDPIADKELAVVIPPKELTMPVAKIMVHLADQTYLPVDV